MLSLWPEPRGTHSGSFLAPSLLLIAGIGLVDHHSGQDLSIVTLYILPVLVATWYGGLGSGLVAATAATTTWYIADWLDAPLVWRLGWNVTEKLAFFAFFAVLVARLKRSTEAVYQRELDIGRDVQLALFNKPLPEIPGLEIATRLVPNRTLSGDYYDFFPRGRDLGLVIAPNLTHLSTSARA